MWPISKLEPGWQRNTQRVLLVGLVLAGIYLAVVFVERARPPQVPSKPAALPLSPDYYVLPPKSYVRSLADARALVGKPLWAREGYRWQCTPGPETLGPMEKVVPRRAFARNRQVWLEFVRDGRPCALVVSSGDSFFVDEIFLIQDPHEIYKDWTPETWKRIEERRIQPGMTETQITFALGYGVFVRELSYDGDAHRVMDHQGGERKMRVTYQYGIAKQVLPFPVQ